MVKRVAEDFDGEMKRFLFLNQASSMSRKGLSSSQMGGIVVAEPRMVVSSAYVIRTRFELEFGLGMVHI